MFLDNVIPKERNQKRHLIKTITWRVLASTDTLIIAWFLTGSPKIGASLVSIEVITKMILYYLHERAWFHSKLGSKNKEAKSQKRHLIKTVTWRVLASTDTLIIGWVLTGSSKIGASIATVEVLTKMILYYLHERAWFHSKLGSKKPK